MEAIMDMSRFITPKKSAAKYCPPVVIGPNYHHQLQALMGETLCVIRKASCLRSLDTLRNTTSRLLQDLYIAIFCHAPPCLSPEYPCASTGSVCSIEVLEGVVPPSTGGGAALLLPNQTTLFLIDLTSRLFRIYNLIIKAECPTAEILPFIACFNAYVFGNYLAAVAEYFAAAIPTGVCGDLAGQVVSNPCNPCDIVYQPPEDSGASGGASRVSVGAPVLQVAKGKSAPKPISVQAPKKIQVVKPPVKAPQKKVPTMIAKSVAEISPPSKPASSGSRFTSLFKSNKTVI